MKINENHNDIYDDNNNIRNKNWLYLSLSNVKPNDWWLEWLKRKKNNRKTSVTLHELMTFKKKYHYNKIKALRIAESFQCTLLKSLAKCDCS